MNPARRLGILLPMTIVLPLLAASVRQGKAPPASPRLELSRARVVDLTHVFDEKTIYWPNSPTTFQLTKLSDGATEGSTAS